MSAIIIDVRESDEFEAEHIEGSMHIPLGEFSKRAPALFKLLSCKSVVLMCRSGKRASLAKSQVSGLISGVDLVVYEGGILAWKSQGKPTKATRKRHFPIMRQVQLVAGSLVLIGSVLAWWVNPVFILLSGFVGAGLTFAGATGFCGMAVLLAKMPWNTVRPESSDELCSVSPSSNCCGN